jgi:hypothetical protein
MSIIDPRRLSGSDIVTIAGKRSAICGAAGGSQANALAFRERTEIVTGRFPVRRSFSAWAQWRAHPQAAAARRWATAELEAVRLTTAEISGMALETPQAFEFTTTVLLASGNRQSFRDRNDIGPKHHMPVLRHSGWPEWLRCLNLSSS